MYASRQTVENNLNGISSSLSSIDTVDRNNNVRASADNLINERCNSTTTSTSILWRANPKLALNKKNSNGTITSLAGTSSAQIGDWARCDTGSNRSQHSDIYATYLTRNGMTKSSNPLNKQAQSCSGSKTVLNFILVPLLMLTIVRQAIDFLGQLWLQILLDFFTTIWIIVALFGIKQQRISYMVMFILWALFNTAWNLIVVCIYSHLGDININEDALSFHTGATSWWHANGPGCLPYNVSSIQPSISILKPNIITGCRVDYKLIESTQAALHASLSFISSLVCCCIVLAIATTTKRKPHQGSVYCMKNLTNGTSKINHNPLPGRSNSRASSNVGSVGRGVHRANSRSSQHSISSARRRYRQPSQSTTSRPRGSTSSVQHSDKYGSLSSRRSAAKRETKRGEVASLTYTNATGGPDRANTRQRTRMSSLSSADYLPSYQPPHSSNTNLLSAYGEISSIDSYNNRTNPNSNRHKLRGNKISLRGKTNPVYDGSRSSIYSPTTNATSNNNYDNISHIYGATSHGSRSGETCVYGRTAAGGHSTSNGQIFAKTSSYPASARLSKATDYGHHQTNPGAPREILVQSHEPPMRNGDTITRSNGVITNGSSSFQTFYKSKTNPNSGLNHNGSLTNNREAHMSQNFQYDSNNNQLYGEAQ